MNPFPPESDNSSGNTTIDDEMDRLLNARSQWPNVDVRMFHGPAGKLVRAIEPFTEADPVGMLVQLLVACGAIIGTRPHVIADSARHRANLFTVLVGDSSKGRKGTSWNCVLRIVRQLDGGFCNDRIVQGSSSGEGWIEHVRDADVKPDLTGAMQPDADSDKRMLVLESELARVLKNTRRENNILSSVMRQAWDNGNLAVMTRHSPARATGAHIAFIGHITRYELERLLQYGDLFNGFANRILWICVRRTKLLPDSDGAAGDTNDIKYLTSELAHGVTRARSVGQLTRTPPATELWRELYKTLAQECEADGGALSAVTSRGEAQVLRLSLVYALLDGADAIHPQHLQAAMALWNYCRDSARYIFGTSTGHNLADDLLVRLRMNPQGLGRKEIVDQLGRHRSAARINEALQRLMDLKLAYPGRRPTTGRTAVVWYPASTKPRPTDSGSPAHNSKISDGSDGSPPSVASVASF